MSPRRPAALAALLLTGGLLLVPTTPAFAAPPFRLADQVTDQVGALDGQDAQVTAALSSLRSDTGVQLWVVYVDTFVGADGQTWADQTAQTSGLGTDDVLLAVATGDRAYAYSVDSAFRLDDAAVQDVARDTETELADEDWAGAAVTGAESLDGHLSPSHTVWWVIGFLAVAGVVVIVAVALVRRHRSRPETSTAQLQSQADTLLVQADDAVRSAAEELQFAAAEFGTSSTAEFTTVLRRSRDALRQAFAARQSLDDSVPESDAERRRILTEVIESCRTTGTTLDEASDAVDALRDLVQRAPAVLTEVEAKLPGLRAGVEPARTLLSSLAAEFGETALNSVADTVAQARDRIGLAERSCTAGRAALADVTRSGEVVDAVRTAEAAAAQAEKLLSGVARTEQDLRRAVQEVPVAIARVRADAQTPVAAATGVPTAEFAAASAAALAVVEASSTQAATDPLAALHRLVEAERSLDAARDAVEEATSARRSAEAALEQALVAARSEIAAADDFISTRRGGIGSSARTNLGEAQRHLDQAVALASQDPAAALEHARQADSLAERASSRAHSDVNSWQRGQRGSDDLGAVLGGILIGGASSRRRGGWSGGGFSGGRSSGGGRGPSGGRRGAGGRF